MLKDRQRWIAAIVAAGSAVIVLGAVDTGVASAATPTASQSATTHLSHPPHPRPRCEVIDCKH
jgi:hypothetical protein